jgi:hypothetical protein
LGPGWLLLKFVPELGHVETEVHDLLARGIAPDLLQDLAMGHHTPQVADEGTEEAEFQRRQVDFLPIHQNPALGQVHPPVIQLE